jgi:hypothetical protein
MAYMPRAKYSTVEEVKEVLAVTEPTWDGEIEKCIVSADSLIDSKLEPYSLSVPETVPQNIKDASKHFAAWLFRKRRDPAGATAFLEEANQFLETYIAANAEGGGLGEEGTGIFRTVSDQ